MLNLEAKTNNEKIVLDYLDKNASYTLAEKINNGKGREKARAKGREKSKSRAFTVRANIIVGYVLRREHYGFIESNYTLSR